MSEQHSLLPMSPGEALRTGREQRNWSVTEVARRLKCNEDIIEALESDDVTGSLAPVYRKGFLKRYASLVGIPRDEVAGWLEESSRGPELRSVFPESHGTRPGDRWLKATSYVLASLLVGTLAWQMSHEAVRLAQKNQEPVVQQGVPQPINNPASTENDNHVNASIAQLESLRSSGNPTSSAGRSAWAALEGESPDLQLEPGEHLISLVTSADSWVEISDRDGRLLEQDLVRGGQSREYRGFGPFQVNLGRTSAVELYVDGQAVDLQPGATDDVTQMRLDPAAITAAVDPAAAGDE